MAQKRYALPLLWPPIGANYSDADVKSKEQELESELLSELKRRLGVWGVGVGGLGVGKFSTKVERNLCGERWG